VTQCSFPIQLPIHIYGPVIAGADIGMPMSPDGDFFLELERTIL
jgi:hypothetical protein